MLRERVARVPLLQAGFVSVVLRRGFGVADFSILAVEIEPVGRFSVVYDRRERIEPGIGDRRRWNPEVGVGVVK